MITYFANVGSRDISIDGNKINRPRIIGKEYLDRFEEIKNLLSYPIIKPGIEYVFNEKQQSVIDRLVLFYTDQPENTRLNFHESDTLFFAQLVKKLVQIEYYETIKKIDLVKIDGAPNNYDLMYKFYSKALEIFKQDHNVEIAYFPPAGGTPACNMNMVLHGSRIFGEKARVILIAEKASPKLINISKEILDENAIQTSHSFLNKFDFSGALHILEKRELGNEFTNNLIRFAESRLRFDFENSIKYLTNAKNTYQNLGNNEKDKIENFLNESNFEDMDDFFDMFFDQINSFTIDNEQPYSKIYSEKIWDNWFDVQKQKIAEVCMNAQLKWEAGEYADFLARIFRIQEAIVRLVFEIETKHSADSKLHPDDFKNYLSDNGIEFKKFLCNNDIWQEINTFVLLAFLKFISKENNAYSKIYKIITRLDKLKDLRNRSIVAHGYAPVGLEQIKKIFGKRPNIEKSIEHIARFFDNRDRLQTMKIITDICKILL